MQSTGWDTVSVKDIVSGCADGTYVLPAIPMEPGWDEAQVALWLDSLWRGYPCGGIVVLREEPGDLPLFRHRPFAPTGMREPAVTAHVLDRTANLVLDGRQRLQALYSSLLGTDDGSILQFDLLSDEDEAFRFAPASAGGLAREGESGALWHSVPALFAGLRVGRDERQVFGEIAASAGITDAALTERIAGNVRRFCAAFLEREAIAIGVVTADHAQREREQVRIVEWFRRLHSGTPALPASAIEELNAARVLDEPAPQPVDAPSPVAHPILADHTSWEAVFAATGARELWVERYVGELRRNRIETIADFARWIVLCGITVRKKQRQGTVYRFTAPAPDGFLPDLAMTEFGGWAWKVALLELADRGFDWLEYVVG